MKKSLLMHWTGYVSGTLGFLALIGAWLAGEGGTTLGFSQQHLYNDATVLVLISISALLCGFWYWHEEKGGCCESEKTEKAIGESQGPGHHSGCCR